MKKKYPNPPSRPPMRLIHDTWGVKGEEGKIARFLMKIFRVKSYGNHLRR